jgi:hypothetical protein
MEQVSCLIIPKKVKVLEAWQDVCRSVYSFALSAASELNDLRSNYPGVVPGVIDGSIFHAAGSLEVLKYIAANCRARIDRRNLED